MCIYYSPPLSRFIVLFRDNEHHHNTGTHRHFCSWLTRLRWRPDMNRKSKNRKIKGYGSGYDSEFWHFSIESQVRFFSHGCTNFLGLHPWLKNRISDWIFFRAIWLADSMSQVCPSSTSPSERRGGKMRRDALNVVDRPCAACHVAASFFSIPWQATFAADYSNVFCKQEKPIESRQKIAILQNVNLCEGLWRLQRRKQP